MSIVKMKRLRLFGMTADREELLKELQHMGCVEIIEPEPVQEDDPFLASLVRADDTDLAARKEEAALLQAALSTLDRYDKVKSKLLALRPEISERQLFDEAARSKALEQAQAINSHEKERVALRNETNKLLEQKRLLAPWLELDVPLDTPSTAEVSVTFGGLSTRAALDELPAALEAAADLCQVIYAGRDADQQYVLVLCHHSQEEPAFETLKRFGFARATFRDWHGTARENTQAIDKRLQELECQMEEAKKGILSLAGCREDLKRCIDRTNQDIRREESKGCLLQSDAVFVLNGWIPADLENRLSSLLSRHVCAWELSDPTPEEAPQVPVTLKNNKFTQPLNMVTNMYVLPAYDGVDPNPLMAPFFIAFFGIMMADMGYGILMIAMGAFVLLKMRPREGMRNFAGLILLCGISTFIVGALTGGFFGDFIPQILKLINPASTFEMPALFTPLGDTVAILVGSLILGLLQIITGMAVSVVRKFQAGNAADAIWDEITWWIILAGIAFAVFGFIPVLIVGLIMLVYGSTRKAQGFGKVTALIGAVYNGVTGFFSDTLSYARLMALMLAGSVIAQVFNTLGAVFGNVVLFVIISFVGNMLNFALNLLGCYVHDLRLQCLEYFGRFYQEGGKPFRPLNIDTKYVDIVKEET